MIGQRTRRFFRHLVCKTNPHGHCDGMLVAYTPEDGDDFALWKNQHNDGTLEDLEEHEMRKVLHVSCFVVSPPPPARMI